MIDCGRREEGMGHDFLIGSTRLDEMRRDSKSEYSIGGRCIWDLDAAFEDA